MSPEPVGSNIGSAAAPPHRRTAGLRGWSSALCGAVAVLLALLGAPAAGPLSELNRRRLSQATMVGGGWGRVGGGGGGGGGWGGGVGGLGGGMEVRAIRPFLGSNRVVFETWINTHFDLPHFLFVFNVV